MTRKKNNTTNKNTTKNKKTNTQNKKIQPRTSKRTGLRKKLKRKKGLHRKKTSAKTKKIITIVCLIGALFIVGFICKKTINFVSEIWPNIIAVKDSMTGGKIDKTNVNSDEQYDINDEKKETLQKRHNVFIDVGCGGTETGYVANDNIKEKDINLKIANQIVKQLSKYDDINVILSRKQDVYMSAEERKSLAKSEDAELFVSIHMASEDSGDAEGVETIYYPDSQNGSSDFAELMQTSIMAFIKAKNRGTNPYEMEVLKDNTIPSIYIQCGFLSNTSDKNNLTDKDYQEQLAEGIAQGIVSYIDAKK